MKIPRFTYLTWMQGTMGEHLKMQLVVESAATEQGKILRLPFVDHSAGLANRSAANGVVGNRDAILAAPT